MIRIDHRVSHDVDNFIEDPQLLPYLDLAKTTTACPECRPTIDQTGPDSQKSYSRELARSTL
ncbi:hypothetical protein V3328_26355 [Microbaculum marinum]|uniref:Uncharacterized protein n=2 Tax=Microbaculum marinum TaxID=1764581 RepID=A0AAW9RN36_9HYPH